MMSTGRLGALIVLSILHGLLYGVSHNRLGWAAIVIILIGQLLAVAYLLLVLPWQDGR